MVGSSFAGTQRVFTPSISISESYDNNIYLDKTNKTSDWITIITAGLNLSISSQKNKFNLNYSTPIVRYKDGENNNTIRQGLSLSFNSSISEHLKFSMSDSFLRSEDPLEETEDIIGVRKTRQPYYRNNANANINYTVNSSSSFSLGFGHSYLGNSDVTIDDGIVMDSNVSYSYRFNARHSMGLDAGYTDGDFSREDNAASGDDYTGNTQGISYQYLYNPYSTFSLNFNYTERDFEGSTTDYGVYQGTLGFGKEIAEDMSSNISFGYFTRRNDDEDNDGINVNISLTKNINRGSFKFSGRSGWNEAYLESERRGFTKYQSVTTSFNYQLTEKISNSISLSYRQDKDESSRKSKSIRASYGLSGSFLKYYSIGLNYSCAVRDDDLESSDYLTNRVTFSLRWSRPYR